mmetsp:Transcript_9139/g.22509  ORF Transcript_9139/g.22509 Transcript_9139/m.22509 type:complete len:357 (+) Transcript_9139:1243-2313(+)
MPRLTCPRMSQGGAGAASRPPRRSPPNVHTAMATLPHSSPCRTRATTYCRARAQRACRCRTWCARSRPRGWSSWAGARRATQCTAACRRTRASSTWHVGHTRSPPFPAKGAAGGRRPLPARCPRRARAGVRVLLSADSRAPPPGGAWLVATCRWAGVRGECGSARWRPAQVAGRMAGTGTGTEGRREAGAACMWTTTTWAACRGMTLLLGTAPPRPLSRRRSPTRSAPARCFPSRWASLAHSLRRGAGAPGEGRPAPGGGRREPRRREPPPKPPLPPSRLPPMAMAVKRCPLPDRRNMGWKRSRQSSAPGSSWGFVPGAGAPLRCNRVWGDFYQQCFLRCCIFAAPVDMYECEGGS